MFYSLIQLQKKFDRNFFFSFSQHVQQSFEESDGSFCSGPVKCWIGFYRPTLDQVICCCPTKVHAETTIIQWINHSTYFCYTYNTVSWSSLEFDLVLPSFRFQFSFVLIECFKQIFCLHSLVLVSKTFPSFLVCHKVYTLGAICYYILTTIKKFKISEMFYL
jgi:hypothetical protein